MSEILSNIVVEQTNINFSPDNNNLNITPEAINLNVFTGAAPVAGGPNTSVQYSNNGVLEGSADFVFDTSNNTVIANLLEVTTTANLGGPSNVRISGGTNGYLLQTDGTGNLSWTAPSGGSGNGVPGGSNTQVQYNDSGLFGGSAGFVFNKISGNLTVPGNISGTNLIGNHYGNGSGLSSITGANVTGSVANATYANSAGTAATVTNNSQPNITSVGTLTALSVSGNVSAGNVNSGNLLTANYVSGTLTTAAQPNITSLGTLVDLSVSGTTSIFEAIENVAIIGAQTGTYNFNMLDGSIQYSTANANANITLNFRGNSTVTADTMLPNAKSITSTYIMTNGTTPYAISNVQIDSSVQTIKWVNGVIPPINGNSTTAYTFTLIKTSTTPTYTVLGSATRYA